MGQIQLSNKAQIMAVTCGPYQGELYSAFGHSAIRVYDPEQNINWIFNWGVFDFNQPNFYLNFAKGYLHYRLAVMNYEPFVDSYIEENRYVHEQVLNLTPQQNQKLFDYLRWNARPENMHYYYDYFYDNCATRVRDVLTTVFKDSIQFDGSYITTNYSIRELCDNYLQQQPWGDLGIDLCLGLPMDKKATPYEYMFLPDYIESGFNHAQFITPNGSKPLVAQTIFTNQTKPKPARAIFWRPVVFTTALLLLGLLLTLVELRKKKHFKVFDISLQTIAGLLGWLLLALWTLTDHNAAARNMNLIWAFPLYFPLAFFLLKRQRPVWLQRFYQFMAVLHAISLLLWFWLPQDLHLSLIPLVFLMLIRCWRILKKQ